MKLPLPEDPKQRALAAAILCSILLHVVFLGSMIWANRYAPALFAKRGETLFVDITPERPEEKAPLGDPGRPAGPPRSPPPLKAPAPPVPRPRIAEAPLPPAPKAPAARPAPEPPKQVGKAASPPPEPSRAPPPPAPEPAPAAPAPQQAAPPPAPAPQAQAAETSKSEDPSAQPTPPSPPARSGAQTALAKPPASIFRQPGGGGGLYGGRGGAVGEPVPLETDDPNYREYMQRVKQRIHANWGYPYEAQTRGLRGELVVEFHIAKDGHLQFIELKRTSGEEILDRFAMNAVKLAQVYDPLPDNMKREVLPIVATFIYVLRDPVSVLQFLK